MAGNNGIESNGSPAYDSSSQRGCSHPGRVGTATPIWRVHQGRTSVSSYLHKAPVINHPWEARLHIHAWEFWQLWAVQPVSNLAAVGLTSEAAYLKEFKILEMQQNELGIVYRKVNI